MHYDKKMLHQVHGKIMDDMHTELHKANDSYNKKTIAMVSMPSPLSKPEKKYWKYQKDWICTDYNKNNLLCITIVSDDGCSWCIEEWVCFSDLPTSDFSKYINMGQHTMLQAAKEREPECYHYTIGTLTKNPEELKKDEYISRVIPEEYMSGKYSFEPYELPVNKNDLKKAIKKCIKIEYQNPGMSSKSLKITRY